MTEICAAIIWLSILGHMVNSYQKKELVLRLRPERESNTDTGRERAVMWRTHPSTSHLLFYNSPSKKSSLEAALNTQY